MDEVLNEFITETNESLATLDVELVRLEREANDREILSNIFRLMHTIKGTCGFLGLPRLEAIAHAGENVLGKFRDGELSVTPEAVSLILKCIDHIRFLIAELERNGAEPEGVDTHLLEQIEAIENGGAPEAAPLQQEMQADHGPVFDDEGFPVAAELLAEIAALAPELSDTLQAAPETGPAAAVETVRIAATDSREQPSGTEAGRNTGSGDAKDTSHAPASIRVNVQVVENLMTLISELVLTRNQLLQTQRIQKGTEFKVPLQRLSHITSDLQEGVTKLRMQPIGNAWSKLPRIVRDLAVETRKSIELITEGAETELDRQVLEMIKDPLTHMVRNAADHGIEDPQTRRALGKPEKGTITLKAYHEGGYIVIHIGDDGKGLDVKRIREKVLANGLAEEAELAAMSEQQVLHFIFRAGFSTAEKVTSVSGRGVGMDVVRTNIERIGGTIDMKSAAGHGTTFLIKIPLTLAIVSALIVETAGEHFAIPQVNVVELVRASERSSTRIEMINQTPVLRLRDRLLPLVLLHNLLGLKHKDAAAVRDHFIVVIQVGAASFGIVVDRVFDTEEIVVKPVSQMVRGISVYAGNTILGDGRVIMILDPNGLCTAAGQARFDTDSAKKTAQEEETQNGELASLLLFRAGGSDLKAVPLEVVTRIEEIAGEAVEHAGGRPVVQYRGHLMPLVVINAAHEWKSGVRQPVLVLGDEGRAMGLVVDEVVDIVRDRLNIELVSRRDGFRGSTIVAGKATDLVDTAYYLSKGFADWRRPGELQSGDGQLGAAA